MTLLTIGSVSEGTGVRFDPGAGFDGVVLASAVLVSTDSNAIQINDGQSLTVYGHAIGANDGILVSAGISPGIMIGATGRVTGLVNGIAFGKVETYASVSVIINNGEIVGLEDDGIEGLGSGFTLLNHGLITGAFGVYFADGSASYIEIVNTGTISASSFGSFGIALFFDSNAAIRNSGTIINGIDAEGATEGLLIVNSGRIISDESESAIYLENSVHGDTVRNSGTISGHVVTGAGTDRVFNTGLIGREVNLGLGNDTYQSSQSGQVDGFIYGGPGNDLLIGGAEAELMDSGDDNDTLRGNAGDDNLEGGSGHDLLRGGLDDDQLSGGIGLDTLTGGAGEDAFLFNVALVAGNIDRISDFSTVSDMIHLENAVFTGLAAGALSAKAFARNTTGTATDASDRILYETDSGKLFFDANGTGAGGRVQVAILAPALALSHADFLVV